MEIQDRMLRYTGTHPKVFLIGAVSLSVKPGDEITSSDELGEKLVATGQFEHVKPASATTRKKKEVTDGQSEVES